MIEEDQVDVVREPQDVARRALALFASFGAAAGADREDLRDWLAKNGLENELTPIEQRFLGNSSPSPQDKANRTWDAEKLIVLLWAMGRVSSLPGDDEQCDTSVFQDHLPPFSQESVADFIANTKLRPEAEIWAMADHCFEAHWRARDAIINKRQPAIPVDIEIIQERHHAINWVTGYDGGVPWDEVTADT